MASLPTGGLIGRFLGTTVATGAGFAFGRAAGPVLSPPLQALKNEVNERYAFVPLSPQMAAQASIVGAEMPDGYAREAAKSGVNGKRYAALQALAGTAPGWDLLRTLWNRGRIDAAQVNLGLAQGMIRPEWHEAVRSLRWILPTGPELAQMAVQGVIAYDAAKGIAADVNTDAATFDRYYRLAGDPIPPDEVLRLWNRGDMSEAQVDTALRQSRLKPEWVNEYKQLRFVLPTVSDMIRFAVREVYDPARRAALNLDAEFPPAFAADAQRLGLDAESARKHWAAHWDLPSYSQGSEMLFRGEITQAQFDGLLAALDYAPTWRGKLAAIARRIPTMTDFQRLARREVYNATQRAQLDLDAEFPAAFATKAALHGMSEQDARDLWAGGWRLPSAGQGYRMLWRGEINETELERLLKALDYAPTWRGKLAAIARPTLGRIDIRRALAAGKLTPTQAVARYQRIGLTQADAELMVSLVGTGASATAKQLTAQQLTTEYEGGFITAAEYQTRLDALGFQPADAQLYRELADSRRVARAREQTLSTIRSAFVGHRLQEGEARARLDALAIAAEGRERIWAEWQSQRAANVKVLTATQIRKLYSNGTIQLDEALSELAFRGYSAREGERLLNL